MHKPKIAPGKRKLQPRALLLLLVLGLLLYLVIPQVHAFKHSTTILGEAVLVPTLLAVLASLAAHATAAAKYNALAFRSLPFPRTLLVQLAGLLTNRLLPVGIGNIGINYLYLRKQRYSVAQAAAVVTMNNVLGFVGHMLLVGVLLLLIPQTRTISLPHLDVRIVVLLAICIFAILLLGVSVLRKRLLHNISAWVISLAAYRQQPFGIIVATVCSVGIALLYALCLWFCAAALNAPLGFVPVLLILTGGVAASSITPTPGGLVGVEAALVGGLVLYHIAPAEALAIALLFRLITYWFALFVGIGAFAVAERKQII